MWLTETEKDRYSRHIRMKEWGEDGQSAVKEARVLLCGLGGIGAAIAPYVAGAGIGTLGLADIDRTELSNLHRQPLYSVDDIGKRKIDAAYQRLYASYPDVTYHLHAADEDPQALLDAIPTYDIVIDGTDRFSARTAIHHACFTARIPLVHAAAEGYRGYVSIFKGYTPDLPCLHCFMPDVPTDGVEAGCSGQGVLGPVPAMIGAMAAAETLKYITRIGKQLTGRILYVDAYRADMRTAVLNKSKDCFFCRIES